MLQCNLDIFKKQFYILDNAHVVYVHYRTHGDYFFSTVTKTLKRESQ